MRNYEKKLRNLDVLQKSNLLVWQDVKKAADTIKYNHPMRKHVDTILLKVSHFIYMFFNVNEVYLEVHMETNSCLNDFFHLILVSRDSTIIC